MVDSCMDQLIPQQDFTKNEDHRDHNEKSELPSWIKLLMEELKEKDSSDYE